MAENQYLYSGTCHFLNLKGAGGNHGGSSIFFQEKGGVTDKKMKVSMTFQLGNFEYNTQAQLKFNITLVISS